MVTKYGMSEKLGTVNYSSSDEVFLGKDFSTRKNYSEEIASEIDEEIRSIIEIAFVRAEELLTDNIDMLHRVANVLLEVETLDAEQFEDLVSGRKNEEQLILEMRSQEKDMQEANEIEAAQHLAELAEEEYREEEPISDEENNSPKNEEEKEDDDDK